MRRAGLFGALLLSSVFVGVLPQMLAWKALYGVFVLPAPPHGSDFLRLDHPYLLNTLFSSRHGLLSWTPVLGAGFLGFLPLLKRRPTLALPLLLPLLVMTWVNVCSGDWWAGGSFSNRRFDGLLPGTVVVEGIWPARDFEGGIGVNSLVGDDAIPPFGGAAFHDTAVWVKPAATSAGAIP